MSTQRTIVWHQLHDESHDERIVRLNETLHQIFFDGEMICPSRFWDDFEEGTAICRLCDASWRHDELSKHSTPRFLQSLDAMQLIVESGKFALVREEYCDWRAPEVKPSMAQYECTIFLYRTGKTAQDNIFFRETGNSRQEAFYAAALSAMGYTVINDEQQ